MPIGDGQQDNDEGGQCYSNIHSSSCGDASRSSQSKHPRSKLRAIRKAIARLVKHQGRRLFSFKGRSGKCRQERTEDPLKPSLGFLEEMLCSNVLEHVYSFLDTPSLLKLSKVSRGINQKIRPEIRVIHHQNIRFGLDHSVWHEPSCLGRIKSFCTPWGKASNSAVPSLIHQLPHYPNLESLSFECRNFRCNDAKALASIIIDEGACTKLKALDFSSNMLRKEGGRAIASCLFCLSDLEELKLSDNSIYFEAALSVCDAVKLGACPKLVSLALSYNWIGVLGSRACGSALGSGCLANLRKLDLRGNGITSVGLCFFVEALLEGIDSDHLSDDDDNDKDADEDGEGISSRQRQRQEKPDHLSPCPQLEEILLSYNYIGSEGALNLAEVISLGVLPNLRILSITHNSVDEASGEALRQSCRDDCFFEY